MRGLLIPFFILCLIVPASYSCAANGIVVVANLQQPQTMKKHEIRNIFMGGQSNLLEPVVLKPGEEARHVFNTFVVGLTEARIQSYWAQMRFSGRNRAPVEVNNAEQMLQYLLENQGAVGYLPADMSIPAQLTVVFTAG